MVQSQVLLCTPSLVVAILGDELHISYFRGTPLMSDMMAGGAVIDRYRTGLKKPIPELIVIEQTVGVPDEEIRHRLAHRMKIRDVSTLGTVMVLEATGFYAAAVRSVLTALHLASRRKSPMRVFASLPEATQFLIRSGWTQLKPAAIVAAVAAIRTMAPTEHPG